MVKKWQTLEFNSSNLGFELIYEKCHPFSPISQIFHNSNKGKVTFQKAIGEKRLMINFGNIVYISALMMMI